MKFAPEELSLINHKLAEFVGMPKSTLDRAATLGLLTTYFIGTDSETRVVRISDVLNYKKHNERPPTEGKRGPKPKKTK